jgi:putative transposase
LHPIIFGHVPPEERHALLRKLSETQVVYPDGTTRKPSLSTLKRKLAAYESQGFEGLLRKPRSDRGKPRAHPQEVIDKAIQLKRDQPKRSPFIINKFLKVLFGTTVPRSSMYTYLKEAGATKLKLGVVKKPVRCRWTAEHTHDLWIGDFANGPYVLVDGEPQPTQLSAFIDCHSRYCVSARYYLRATFDILIDTLLRAWDVHGASLKLYLDNAKVYHAVRLKAACYALHVEILHRPVRDPSPGGLVERFIQTAQGQFEAEVRAKRHDLTLPELNRAFSAWLDVVYHQHVHADTQQTPEQRYHAGLTVIRQVDLASVIPFFMVVCDRTVHRDFSDVQIQKIFFRVNPKLRGDRVQVRYDPYGDKESVLIYSLKGQFLCRGVRHNREKVFQPPHVPPSPKAEHDFLKLCIDEHDKRLDSQAQGIDFAKLSQAPRWPFAAFVKTLAQLMGLQGGLNAFSPYQLEAIQKTFDRSPCIDKTLLMDAFEQASDGASLPEILYQIKSLAQNLKPKE